MSGLTNQVVKAIGRYQRTYRERPASLYVCRADRAALYEEFRGLVPGTWPEREPPLYEPLFVMGVAVFALHGVLPGSVDAIMEHGGAGGTASPLSSLMRGVVA